MPERTAAPRHAIFDIPAIAAAFPERAETMLIDDRLVDRPAASARVFRIYTPVPAHYHATCDEFLFVLSGRARFFLGDDPPEEVGPGKLLVFERGVVHGAPEILEEPFTVLSVDTPRGDPQDVIFVDPAQGNVATFIKTRTR